MIKVCKAGHVVETDNAMKCNHEKCNRKLYILDELVEKLWNALFRNYIPNWYDEITNKNDFRAWMSSSDKSKTMKDNIRQLLLDGYKVHTGYMSTSIRGIHNRIIFYDKN